MQYPQCPDTKPQWGVVPPCIGHRIGKLFILGTSLLYESCFSTGKLATALLAFYPALPSMPPPSLQPRLPFHSGSPCLIIAIVPPLTLKVWEKGQWRALLCAIMSIWCYSRWERLWGSGQIRRKEGSSRCWSRMMYCCSLWDSDNTSTKVEQGKGGKIDPSVTNWARNQADSKESISGVRGSKEKSRIFSFCACAFLKHSCGFNFFSAQISLITVLSNSLGEMNGKFRKSLPPYWI